MSKTIVGVQTRWLKMIECEPSIRSRTKRDIPSFTLTLCEKTRNVMAHVDLMRRMIGWITLIMRPKKGSSLDF